MTMELHAEQIANWLRERPDFFMSQPELLDEMRIPHQVGTVSLLEYQAQQLREQNTKLRERLNGLTQIAQVNEQLFKAMRKLLLRLLDADTLDELLHAIERGLLEDFQVPQVSVLLFKEKRTPPLSSHYPQRTLTEAKKAIGSLLKGGGQLCGALRDTELDFLFAEQAKTISSAAVLPLRGQRLYGLLALGSPDPERYCGAQGTLFIDYLAEVLPCLLKRFLLSH